MATSQGPSRDPAVPVGSLPTLPGATVAIVLVAGGYPDAPRSGDAVEGLADAAAIGALVFHAGTRIDGDGTVRTTRGRVLSVVGRGADVPAAAAAATRAADLIHAPGLGRRHDIGGGPSPDREAARSAQPAGSLAR